MRAVARSLALHERALPLIPRGTHSDSRARQPHPIYFERAEGAWIFDVDGNRYLDCQMGNGAVVLGHAHPAVSRAVCDQVGKGLLAGLEGELSVVVAEKFLRCVPTADAVRFSNTGTEAVMHAFNMARAHTGKPDIAKPEGSYHGWYDYAFVSAWPEMALAGEAPAPRPVPGMAGLHPTAVDSTVILPFNNLAETERIVRTHADRLAAIIVEPIMIDVGWIPAEKAYLALLRKLCSELGIVLIFDELLTGFRVARGGAQELYGVRPDLSIFGKALSNGFILTAIAGSKHLLDPASGGTIPFRYVGTYNSHQVSLAASQVVLDLVLDGSLLRGLQETTEVLTREFETLAKKAGVPARLCGGGGHFHWYFMKSRVHDYRSAARSDKNAYSAFHARLWEAGVFCSPNPLGHHCISSAHGEREMEFLLRAMQLGLEAVRR